MVPDRYPVSKGRRCACGGNPFPPALLEHTGVSRQQQAAMWKYIQDTKRMSFPINPSHHLFGEYLSASWLNIGNRLNISATYPSADLDISQSHANQIPKSLVSPHSKDNTPSRFAELQGAPGLGGGW